MHRPTILIARAAIGIGILGACGTSDSASAATATVEAGDFYFKPATIGAAAGKPTKIVIENRGNLTHNLSITSLGISKDVAAGENTTVTVTPKQSGTLQFVCSYHITQGMTGSLTVN